MAEELGDDDEVGPASYEGGGEGVAEDVGGDLVVEAGALGDAGDDVVGTFDAEPLAAFVEDQRRCLSGAGPAGPFVEPGEGGAQLGVDRDLTDPLALAVDAQGPLPCRDADVVDVEGDDLADAGAGVEGDEGDGLVNATVPSARSAGHGCELADGRHPGKEEVGTSSGGDEGGDAGEAATDRRLLDGEVASSGRLVAG